MIQNILFALLWLSAGETGKSPDIQTKRLPDLMDEEVATYASALLPKTIKKASFGSCVPRESRPFDGSFPKDWEESIYSHDALKDLAKCSSKECAFNFLKSELAQIEALSDIEARRKFYRMAYVYRSQLKLGSDPERSPKFLRSRDQAFEYCSTGSAYEELLNQRPLRDLPFRLSHVKYNKRMRPTTRLVQGVNWQADSKTACYAEALIFSDHYDIDRVEVWSLTEESDGFRLRLDLRHRIDLLNTWFRRLNKEKFRKEADSIVEKYLEEAIACMSQTK